MISRPGYTITARYYDSRVGRFISEDPIGFDGDGPNLYGYVLNDPVDMVDPWGLLARAYHYDISYYAAIMNGASPAQADEFAKAVWAVDIGTQSTDPKDTKLHYMAGKGQNSDQGIAATEEMLKDPNTSLAKKAHALQDGAAPWHKGKSWKGWKSLDSYWHLLRYGFPGDKVLQDAYDVTDALLKNDNPWQSKMSCP